MSWLFFISALTPILAIAVSKSLVYDNDRMYMAAFPFLAALAGVGFTFLLSIWKKASSRWNKPALLQAGTVLLFLLAFAPELVTMVRLYPHYLSYYGEGVGGVSGANKLGLETTYWCESYSLAFPIINEQAQYGDSIWADPWSHDVLIYYQMGGIIREDLKILAPYSTQSILGPNAPQPHIKPMGLADWYIVQQRQSTLGFEGEENEIPKILKGREKVIEYAFDGVTIFELYKK